MSQSSIPKTCKDPNARAQKTCSDRSNTCFAHASVLRHSPQFVSRQTVSLERQSSPTLLREIARWTPSASQPRMRLCAKPSTNKAHNSSDAHEWGTIRKVAALCLCKLRSLHQPWNANLGGVNVQYSPGTRFSILARNEHSSIVVWG